MAGKVQIDWPSDDELVALVEREGSKANAARALGVHRRTFTDRLERISRQRGPEEPVGVRQIGDKATITLPAAEGAKLGKIEDLIRESGLDPNDWVIGPIGLSKWNAMTSDKKTGDNRIVEMRQWKVTLLPHPRLVLVQPAVHVPPVKRRRVGPPASDKPELIVVESDHHAPFHCKPLHEASVAALRDLAKKHRLAEHVYLGDTGDYSNTSKHADHPATMNVTPNLCIQVSYDLLREKREAAPNIRVRKLKGNHDWRLESEQLMRAERMYGIAPATEWGNEPEKPALHLDRLLHLPKLGIELVEDPRGWMQAEVELVPGLYGLVCRHGWISGANTAERSVRARGRSIIVGHIHKREHKFIWDPSAQCERQGVVCPTMAEARSERSTQTHYMALDTQLQGFVIVTRWPDGDFCIEHAKWNGNTLRWRDYSWRA